MLTGLASLMFGSSGSADGPAAVPAASLPPLITSPAPDLEGWTFVDRGDPIPGSSSPLGHDPTMPLGSLSDNASNRITCQDGLKPSPDFDNVAECCHSNQGYQSDSLTWASCWGGARDMDGSWLVTPPPIFTLGGAAGERIEEDPMEDLLIEHPSMSVYDITGRQFSGSSRQADSVSSRKKSRRNKTQGNVSQMEKDSTAAIGAPTSQRKGAGLSSATAAAAFSAADRASHSEWRRCMQLSNRRASKSCSKKALRRSTRVAERGSGRPMVHTLCQPRGRQ